MARGNLSVYETNFCVNLLGKPKRISDLNYQVHNCLSDFCYEKVICMKSAEIRKMKHLQSGQSTTRKY